MSESYLTSVTPDIRKAYEYQRKANEVAQLFGDIVVKHAFIGGERSEYQLILPLIVWGGEPDMRGYFSLMDYDGELLFGDETGAGAKELAEQVRSAELELREGYSGPILTIDISEGRLMDYAQKDLTLDQLNGTITDLKRYEQGHRPAVLVSTHLVLKTCYSLQSVPVLVSQIQQEITRIRKVLPSIRRGFSFLYIPLLLLVRFRLG